LPRPVDRFGVRIRPDSEILTADKHGRFRVEGIASDLVAWLLCRSRSQPDVFLAPGPSREAALEHVTARSGEIVDLAEIGTTRPPND
jgi:hypothetical protein